jgi:hypothetical protein
MMPGLDLALLPFGRMGKAHGYCACVCKEQPLLVTPTCSL